MPSSDESLLLGRNLDVIYDTVSSPDPGDDLDGVPYDQAFARFLKKGTGRTVAINGAGSRWIRALLGIQGGDYRLIMTKRSHECLKVMMHG